MAPNYYRGLLGIDRVKGARSLREEGDCRLAAVADHALADQALDLLQERHCSGDYSYYGAVRASVGSVVEQVPGRFPMHLRSEHPGP
jgi:hypothetical protein